MNFLWSWLNEVSSFLEKEKPQNFHRTILKSVNKKSVAYFSATDFHLLILFQFFHRFREFFLIIEFLRWAVYGFFSSFNTMHNKCFK